MVKLILFTLLKIMCVTNISFILIIIGREIFDRIKKKKDERGKQNDM